MKRALATVQEIAALNPIIGADFIETATILGWKLVVKKGWFNVGDKCCFFEIDSLLPKDKKEFAFMESKHFRVQIAKFKKQISQGLALPLSSLSVDFSNYNIGDDVTEILGVTKWEPALDDALKLRGAFTKQFPFFISKTDETRIQSIPETLDVLKGKDLYFTEKLDGSSITIFYLKEPLYNLPENYLGVCSRNMLILKEEENAFWQVVIKNNLEAKILEYNKSFCIQGELVGAGIKKNKYNLKGRDIYVYSCYDIVEQKYLGWKNVKDICNVLGLMTVPYLGEFKLNHSVDDLVEMSIGNSVLNQSIKREGIVCRCSDEFFSFKVINPYFLLKYDSTATTFSD